MRKTAFFLFKFFSNKKTRLKKFNLKLCLFFNFNRINKCRKKKNLPGKTKEVAYGKQTLIK